MKDLFSSAKVKIAFISISGFLVLYSIIGFLIIPAVLLNQTPKLVDQHLSRTITIEDIQFNPFSMEFNVQNVNLKNKDDSTFASFERFYINVAVLQSIADFSLFIDKIHLRNPFVFIQRDKQGEFNFSDLLVSDKEKVQETENNDVFPVTVTQIKIVDGKASWEDRFYSQTQREDISPLNLTLNNFTTKVDSHSQLGFSLLFASGGEFNWQGKFQLKPLQSSGQITLEKINFHKIWSLFLQDSVNFELLKGSEHIAAHYQLMDTDNGIQLLIDEAHINLLDIQIAEKGNATALIDVPDFKLSGIALNLLQKSVEISQISANNAKFKAQLNADGSINYQSLFAIPTNSSQTPQSGAQVEETTDEKPWQLLVKQLALANFSLHFVDKSLATPVTHNISALNLTISDISNQAGASLPFELALKLNESGFLSIQGSTVLDPFSSNLQLDLGQIALKDFQPYIDQFAHLDIISGAAALQAKVTLAQKSNKPLQFTLQGNSNISQLITQDPVSNKNFVTWKKLSLKKIDIDLAANQYSIDTIKFDRPYARVLIKKDKTLNFNDIVLKTEKEEKVVKNKTTATTTKTVSPKVKINQIEIVNGSSDFSDFSLILPFSAHLKKLKGTVKGISSDKNASIRVALNGRVGGLSPVKIRGKITPSQGNSAISLDFKSMSLPLVTPYMAEFAGRKIEKGNLSLKLNYKIKNHKLTASNSLLIDQLELGDEVKNPKAVSLPLDLAIALLADADGKIKLDVPITGSLEDPDFSIAGIVVDALVNVITKIISSPFSAISSLIGSDEDISKITFAAGNAVLNSKQQEKLNGLSTALIDRPALQLEIKGTSSSTYDWPKLQAEALKKQLIQIKADTLNQDNNKQVAIENITLNDEEYNEFLADLFIQKFPQLAEKSFFGTPKLIDPTQGDFYQMAKQKLAATIPPNKQRLHNLAASRAKAIATYLLEKNIVIDRLYLIDVDVDPEQKLEELATVLNLRVN